VGAQQPADVERPLEGSGTRGESADGGASAQEIGLCPARHPDRDAPFGHIADQRQAFTDAGLPIVSVDTKKKELIGAFKNAGRAWSQDAEAVNVHDFPSDAQGRAVPYGVYDVTRNQGTVYVGASGDTAQFAVDALARWWATAGRATYPTAAHLLVLADGGGRNGYRSHLWKQQLQERLCDGLGLTVTVCHYPRGCSTWNPIEHRLFGPISLNWAGQLLGFQAQTADFFDALASGCACM